MKKKNWIIPGIIILLGASFFLMIGFSSHASAKKARETCNFQPVKNCSKVPGNPAPAEIGLENLSRQFLSIFKLGY